MQLKGHHGLEQSGIIRLTLVRSWHFPWAFQYLLGFVRLASWEASLSGVVQGTESEHPVTGHVGQQGGLNWRSVGAEVEEGPGLLAGEFAFIL